MISSDVFELVQSSLVAHGFLCPGVLLSDPNDLEHLYDQRFLFTKKDL